ncbi:MAG: hypothetical protein IPJ30_04035 [Acidobacteria bacterium]|nr:hypothetical protein [Acidobacteriota bacterium]MBK8149001.1 hypothetical protein [Acidobacteriota bacterium]
MKLPIEHKSEPLLPWRKFASRMLLSLSAGTFLVMVSLAVGTCGYRYFEDLSWLDALLNASMILSGMGPMANPGTGGGKIFASIYALYSGFAVLVIAGIAFGPVVHRLFHRLHIDESDFPKEG